MNQSQDNPFRALPRVDDLLDLFADHQLFEEVSRTALRNAIREDLDEARATIKDEQLDADDIRIRYEHKRCLKRLQSRLKARQQRVHVGAINGTGVVLHTGLGRAVLSEAATAAIQEASGYTILEVERSSGHRNRREDGVTELLREITGAPAATVVNNNAAATLITLAALAAGKEVIVARSQLVEIGGSFRIPDILKQSGARLVEVGCTNKVHLRDYEQAITDNTGLILRVHCSNYRIVGFTSEVSVEELVKLGQQHHIPVMDDLGSGCFVDLSPYGLPHEPRVQDSVAFGSNVITFSGDKLLGGPQAGLIIGDADIIGRIRKHPLCRAMRPDKLTFSALEATLKHYQDMEQALSRVPVLHMLTQSPTELEQRAHELKQQLDDEQLSTELSVVPDSSKVGGGAYAVESLDSYCLGLVPLKGRLEDWARRLRLAQPPVFVRIKDERLLIDLRTVLESQEAQLVEVLIRAFRAQPATLR